MMRTLLAIAAAAAISVAFAQDKKLTAQQQRMVDCNKDASAQSLKGQERQDFMSKCLRGDTAAAGATQSERADKESSQQDRMTSCNHTASDRDLKAKTGRTSCANA